MLKPPRLQHFVVAGHTKTTTLNIGLCIRKANMSPFYQVVVTTAERFCFVFLYRHWSVKYRSFLHKVFSIGTKRRIVNKKSALISRLVLFEDHSGLQVKTEHKPGHVMQFPTSNAKNLEIKASDWLWRSQFPLNFAVEQVSITMSDQEIDL